MCPESDKKLQLQVEDVGDAVVVYVRGEVNLYEADTLRAELESLASRKIRRVVLELSQMTFICSDGLGAIIAAHLACRHHQGRILLAAPRQAVHELFKATRLTELFPVFQTVDEALVA